MRRHLWVNREEAATMRRHLWVNLEEEQACCADSGVMDGHAAQTVVMDGECTSAQTVLLPSMVGYRAAYRSLHHGCRPVFPVGPPLPSLGYTSCSAGTLVSMAPSSACSVSSMTVREAQHSEK